MLALTGTPVNVIVSDAAIAAGGDGFGFFEFGLAGLPLLLACIAVVVVLGPRLLPVRTPRRTDSDEQAWGEALGDWICRNRKTVLVASTLLNAGYFLPIVYRAFFVAPSPHDQAHPHGEAPLTMVVAVTATAAATVLLFFLPEVPLALARQMLSGE
jgi:di/tricarboxylate transporter